MNPRAFLLEQLARAQRGPAWSGPSVAEVLKDVDAVVAARRALPGAHTIWELVQHIAAWEDIARGRLLGERGEVTPEMDWPPVGDTDAHGWNETLQRLELSHEALRVAIEQFPEARFDEPLTDTLSAAVLLHGVVQHDLYHAGQIAILKKGNA